MINSYFVSSVVLLLMTKDTFALQILVIIAYRFFIQMAASCVRLARGDLAMLNLKDWKALRLCQMAIY